MSTAASAAFVFVESSQAGTVGALSQVVAKLSQYILKAYPGNGSPVCVFTSATKLSQYIL
jgi:hypothetical protein